MNKFIGSFLAALVAVAVLFAPSVALAQNNRNVQDGLNDIKTAFPDKTQNFANEPQGLVKTLIEWALYIGAMLAVVFIIIGGYQYLTSAGNEEGAKKGRKTVAYALIGLIIIILSWVIVQTVYDFLTR